MNHVEQLRELVAAGEKAPDGKWYEQRHSKNDGGELSYAVASDEVAEQHADSSGESHVFEAFHNHGATWPHIDWRAGSLEFVLQAANSRDSVAWALRVVGAAMAHLAQIDKYVDSQSGQDQALALITRSRLDALLAEETNDAT